MKELKNNFRKEGKGSQRTTHLLYSSVIILLLLSHLNRQKNSEEAGKEEISLSSKSASSLSRTRAVSNENPSSAAKTDRKGKFVELNEEFSPKRELSPTTSRSLRFARFLFEQEKDEILAEHRVKLEETGLPAGAIDVALTQIQEIEVTRQQIQFLQDQIEFQRADYDDHLQAKLTVEDYQSYRQREEDDLFGRYLEDFNSNLDEQHRGNLDIVEQKELQGLLKEIKGGVTIDRSRGPYGEPTAVKYSTLVERTGAYHIADQISLMEGEKQYLLEHASSERLRAAVQQRYERAIQEYLSFED